MAADEKDPGTLLRDGQTVAEWWAEHGINVETARGHRAARYAEQRAASLTGCRAIAARETVGVG